MKYPREKTLAGKIHWKELNKITERPDTMSIIDQKDQIDEWLHWIVCCTVQYVVIYTSPLSYTELPAL
jgi:hypothetical protein